MITVLIIIVGPFALLAVYDCWCDWDEFRQNRAVFDRFVRRGFQVKTDALKRHV